MRISSRLPSLVFCSVLLAVACDHRDDPDGGLDSSIPFDSDVPMDAGEDAGDAGDADVDASLELDGGEPTDGGDPTDAGPVDGGGADAGTPTDGGGGTDSGAPTDAGGGTDSGAPTDAGGGTDSGTPTDAGGGTDSGTPTDAGGEPDAGPPAGCLDMIQNGDETDVDCGGSCPTGCDAGEMCGIGADCASSVCVSGECIGASCTDGILNGDETDRDCGGPACGGCDNGQRCDDVSDCAALGATCTAGFCQPGSCANMMLDAPETDVDCGGGTCAPCADGAGCVLPRDCLSGLCALGACIPSSCTNGMLDMGEVGVDCGGPCSACPDGTACTMPADCLSDRCEGSVCASCNDGVTSGTETDVDCGGDTCGGCPGGRACTVNEDCSFGLCQMDGTCNGPDVYYFEDFEGGDGGWVATGSWEYGMPDDFNINSANSGDNAWVTDLDADYPSNEFATLTSPVIDLSALTNAPSLFLARNYITESSWDGAYVEVSTNGTDWTKLGAAGEGINWYNSSSDQWWDGSSGGWEVAQRELTGLAGSATAQIRFVFESDGSSTREGVAIDDIVIRDLVPNLSVDITPVPDLCGTARVTVTNDGDLPISTVDFAFGLEGDTTTETLTDLDPGDSVSRDVPVAAGQTVVGSLSGAVDANPSDDSVSVLFESTAIPVDGSMPYTTDFEADDGGWIATGNNSTWEWATPAGTVITGANSGTLAWITNADGDYLNSDRSLLISPCLDASSSAADLSISFALNYESESCCDELTVEYSVDGGVTWTRVTSGTDWYNTSDGFAGDSGDWLSASAPLPGTAGKPNVRVRYRMDADGSSVDEGFAIDDVTIEPLGAPDLAGRVQRTASCNEAEVVVENVGSAPVSAYALTVIADGVMTRTTVLEPILPGETIVYTVEASEVGVVVETPGDANMSNDADSLFVIIPVTGGYLENFDADDGGYLPGGTNSSWEHGAPEGTFINGPASGVSAWVTNLSGAYNGSEFSTLTSACFDFSALGADPTLSFSHIYETEGCCDRGWVEVSTDEGATWRKVGRTGEGTNWYDDPILDWWNGSSGAPGTWRTAEHLLDGTAGEPVVRFRFVLFTDSGLQEEGFGVDDVSITP